MTIGTFRNLLATMTFRRLWNLVLIQLSFRWSLMRKRAVVFCKPWTLTIEPTNRCNLRCPECPSGAGILTRPFGAMDMDLFERIIDETRGHVFYIQLFFQGEPLLHRRLIDMIEYARRKRIYVSISTNAQTIDADTAMRLVASRVERLIVSLDGLTEDTYPLYRVGGSFEKTITALEYLTEARRNVPRGSRTGVTIQFLVTKDNETQIPLLREIGRKYDAQVALKTIQVYSLEGAKRFLPSDERYSRYRITDGILLPRSDFRNRCLDLWARSVITWDGVVVPCCFDKDAEHPLGNLQQNNFAAIWRSESYDAFRNKILHDRRGVEMCMNCTEGLNS